MLEYHSKLRRRIRQVQRLGATSPGVPFYKQKLVRAFWWDGHKNFGDMLTPELLTHFGFRPFLRPATEASLVGVGSILEMIPPTSGAIIWGSGLMHDHSYRIPNAKAAAVRGALTRDHLGLSEATPLGDPGLLAPMLYPPRATKSNRIVVLPHQHHEADPQFARLGQASPHTTLLSTATHPRLVAKEISGASAVLTSSLHGLIFADAYGVPATWITTDVSLYGADFKFRDYSTAVQYDNYERHCALTKRTTLNEALSRAASPAQAIVTRVQGALTRALLGALTQRS